MAVLDLLASNPALTAIVEDYSMPTKKLTGMTFLSRLELN